MRSAIIRGVVPWLAILLLLSGCAQEQQASSGQMDYKEMKSMVVDILKTEEAQKAIQSSQSGSMQMQSVNIQQAQEQIRLAVKDTLVSPDYQKEFEKIMKDPKFAAEFAKVINKDNKQLHKELIKDPAYQQAVGDVLKSPDLMKSYLDIMKTPEYRKQLMAIMKESMNTPLFKLQVMELLSKVVKEELEPKQQGSEQQGQQGQSGGGQDGEGGSGGGGGGDSGGGGGGSQ